MVKSLYYPPNRVQTPDSGGLVASTTDSPPSRLEIVRTNPPTSTPSQRTTNVHRIPVYFLLGHEIIQHIEDFFTLYNLSRSCQTFYHIVNSHRKLQNTLFDQLETPKTSDWQGPQGGPNYLRPRCNRLLLNKYRAYYRSNRYRWDRFDQRELENLMETTDITRDRRLQIEELFDPMFLVCYACRKVKGTTQFFEHHRERHLALLGCRAQLRRCIDCDFDRPVEYFKEQNDDSPDNIAVMIRRQTYLHVGNLKTYLIDMPQGYPGFRQHCQVCKSTSWARTRPTKTRETRKVCEDCYQKGMSATKVPGRNDERAVICEEASRRKAQSHFDTHVFEPPDPSLQAYDIPYWLSGFGFEVLREQLCV